MRDSDARDSSEIHVVVLAAGQGTRMKSQWPKVLHKIAGHPLIEHVLRAARPLSATTTSVVIGHKAELMRDYLGRYPALAFATQEPQLGTAHALQQVEPILSGRTGTLVLLSGDVPLLSAATLQSLVQRHCGAKAAATVVTAAVERPF